MTGVPRPTRAPAEIPPPTRLHPSGAWMDWLTLFLLVALTVALAAETLLVKLDLAVRAFSDGHRPPAVEAVVKILNMLGQGLPLTVICLGLAAFHVRRLKTWEPLVPVVAVFVLNYVSIGAVKMFTDRGAPHYGSVLLFSEPGGWSYPSGHTSNVVVWYGLLSMLLAPLVWPWLCRLLRFGPPVVVTFATTYLGYHWLSDAIAGLLIGVLIDRAVRRNLWRRSPWVMRHLRWRRVQVEEKAGAGLAPPAAG